MCKFLEVSYKRVPYERFCYGDITQFFLSNFVFNFFFSIVETIHFKCLILNHTQGDDMTLKNQLINKSNLDSGDPRSRNEARIC